MKVCKCSKCDRVFWTRAKSDHLVICKPCRRRMEKGQ